jgi:hypothetical protein
MKYFLIATASLCMIVLSGCMSISEPEAPALTGKFATEANLHLEGFQLYTVREKQYHSGYTYGTAYNFRTDSWSVVSGSYSGTSYERMLDDKFPEIVKDIFESAGANIRADKTELTIEGWIGTGHYMWSSPAMWYRDAPIFVVSVCTIGMVMSKERENNVRLLIYNKEGKRLKEYSATARYYTIGFGLPLAYMVNEKIRAWYCDRMAAKFALIKCMNEFVRDYNNGFYNLKN